MCFFDVQKMVHNRNLLVFINNILIIKNTGNCDYCLIYYESF